MKYAAISDSASASAPQPIQRDAKRRSMRSRGTRTQYSSSSMRKLTHSPNRPLRAEASRV